MFPNVRLMIVAVLASLVGISCGMGLFAVFRVNHEPLARLASGSGPLVFADTASAPATDSRAAPFGVRFQVNAPGGAAEGNVDALRLGHGAGTATGTAPSAVTVSVAPVAASPSAPSPAANAGSAKASATIPAAAGADAQPATRQEAGRESNQDIPQQTEAANEPPTERPSTDQARPRAMAEITPNATAAQEAVQIGTGAGSNKDGLANAAIETPAAQVPAAPVVSEAEPEMKSGAKDGAKSGGKPPVKSVATVAERRTIRAKPSRPEKASIKAVPRRHVVRRPRAAQPTVQPADQGFTFTQPAFQATSQIQTQTAQPVQRRIVVKRRRATKKTAERAPAPRIVVGSTTVKSTPR
jgi:hypothetical protein